MNNLIAKPDDSRIFRNPFRCLCVKGTKLMEGFSNNHVLVVDGAAEHFVACEIGECFSNNKLGNRVCRIKHVTQPSARFRLHKA
jgi:hypothetical protein